MSTDDTPGHELELRAPVLEAELVDDDPAPGRAVERWRRVTLVPPRMRNPALVRQTIRDAAVTVLLVPWRTLRAGARRPRMAPLGAGARLPRRRRARPTRREDARFFRVNNPRCDGGTFEYISVAVRSLPVGAPADRPRDRCPAGWLPVVASAHTEPDGGSTTSVLTSRSPRDTTRDANCSQPPARGTRPLVRAAVVRR